MIILKWYVMVYEGQIGCFWYGWVYLCGGYWMLWVFWRWLFVRWVDLEVEGGEE